MIRVGADVIIIKSTVNVMHLNHPETTPPPPPTPIHGKTVFHETGPWCQIGLGPLLYGPTINKHFKFTLKNLK